MHPTIWKLRSGADRRFRAGHPWVYSNELAESPKGLEPGAPVELRDAAGKFLARGYGNPHSLIAFRTVSRVESEQEPLSVDGLARRLQGALELRVALGRGAYSYRLCFGEADGLPGLVIDRYVVSGGRQVFVVQAHSAGADRLIRILPGSLKLLESGIAWENTAIVVRNDVGVRKLEGLQEEEARLAKDFADGALSASQGAARIAVQSAASGDAKAVEFDVRLLDGQKTGFFLDQAGNVKLAVERLGGMFKGKVRVLDLCCYVGQWSTQLARAFRAQGLEVEVTLFDASAQALELAKANAEREGAKVAILKGDVLRDLADLKAEFDLVISDPPALIKGRKDIPQGTHAYLQLHTQAVRLTRDRGALAACSCSALLEEEEFARTLAKAAGRGKVRMSWIARGGQAPDHPVLAEFPEGRYLKCWIGIAQKESL